MLFLHQIGQMRKIEWISDEFGQINSFCRILSEKKNCSEQIFFIVYPQIITQKPFFFSVSLEKFPWKFFPHFSREISCRYHSKNCQNRIFCRFLSRNCSEKIFPQFSIANCQQKIFYLVLSSKSRPGKTCFLILTRKFTRGEFFILFSFEKLPTKSFLAVVQRDFFHQKIKNPSDERGYYFIYSSRIFQGFQMYKTAKSSTIYLWTGKGDRILKVNKANVWRFFLRKSGPSRAERLVAGWTR